MIRLTTKLKKPKTSKMVFIVKIHNTENGNLVSVCDKEIFGKRLEDENCEIDLSKNFYAGEEKSEQELINILDKAYMINVVGNNAVKLMIELGLVDPDHVLEVQGVKHAQALVVR